MKSMDRINSAIDYVEAHITEEIDLQQVAQRACCSVYHFQRMFSYIADISISEYIRRRRLTLAAFDLLNSGEKVIDVAAKYLYQSPEAFSRAFKSMHGVNPTHARNSGTQLKAFPRLSFHLSLDGDSEISYQIKQSQAFEVCGMKTDIIWDPDRNNTQITQFWDDNINSGVIAQFHRDIGLDFNTPLNAALFNYTPSKFSYMICYDSPAGGAPSGYYTLPVPPLTWAVFFTPKHPGPETTRIVRRLRERIYLEWFPTSGYTQDVGPEFEIFKRANDLFVVEVWIPIARID
ncbi:helix-turn-helix domain-containing protein [Cohnella lubricantis]|uniref:AraC family transcriptional regulator n=1 Tax=Cohnella lubricantis TaxID=2163172 RepID=A0A841TH05_9BACL|nr:helix-turn-helix domain-containing protein [Cohnella lubricantis]MBB6678538.1 AraC family transcriptional regulator [Cohnella lubricantis]MBP2119153.1 AraC family transcriptional regulator [Cohnella lubricantis]